MSRYEDEKMKWDQTFNRCLSDREFAEGLLERLDEEMDAMEDLMSERDELTEALSKESKKPKMSERWAETIAKVESIMQIPAEEHIVRITIGDYSGVDISFEVKGWKEEVSE